MWPDAEGGLECVDSRSEDLNLSLVDFINKNDQARGVSVITYFKGGQELRLVLHDQKLFSFSFSAASFAAISRSIQPLVAIINMCSP